MSSLIGECTFFNEKAVLMLDFGTVLAFGPIYRLEMGELSHILLRYQNQHFSTDPGKG